MSLPLLTAAFSLLQLAAQTRLPPAAYSIAGTVVDSVTGNAVRHAKLYLATGTEEIFIDAEANGSFRVTGLEAGKYQFYASAPGYVRQGLDQHGAFFTGLVVGPNVDSEHVLFRIAPQAIVHGRITDE